MKVFSVVGNRPQFVKAAPTSVALRERGIDEVVLHTGQHYDRELSQVFFEELGLDEPRYALDLRTADVTEMQAAIAGAAAGRRRRTGCSSTATRTRRWRARWPPPGGSAARTRRGGPAQRRPLDARGAEPDRGRQARGAAVRPDERSRDQLAAEGVPGRAEVVGDVMADATRLFEPIARERALEPVVDEPLRRAHDPPRGEHRARAAARPDLETLSSTGRAFVFPVHPRTRKVLDEHGIELAPQLHADRRRSATSRCSRSSPARAPSSPTRAACRRRPTGCACLRDAAALDRVGGHGHRRREHARRRTTRPAAEALGRRIVPRGRAAALRRRPRGRRGSRKRSIRFRGHEHDRHRRGRLRRRAARPASSRTPGETVVLVDVQADRVDAAEPRRELHRGRALGGAEGATSTPGWCRRRPTTTSCEGADAILVALPTPLSEQREPDLTILLDAIARDREAPPEGPARRARVDDVPRHDARAASRRCSRRAASRPARTSTWPSRPSASIPAARTGRRRPRRRSSAASPRSAPRARSSSTRAPSTSVVEVSSPEAAELTKLLENIFRSVNIALVNELAQLCDRMGLDVWEVVGRGGDQAVRVHALRARPGPRRPLPPGRSVLPLVEGARSSTSTPSSSSSPGKVNAEHAVLLPLADLAGAEPRRERSLKRLEGARRSASPTRPTSPTRASRRR